MKKRKRASLFTPEERAVQRVRQRQLEERIRIAEAELAAAGSPFAKLDRRERLDYALERAEAELAAKRAGD